MKWLHEAGRTLKALGFEYLSLQSVLLVLLLPISLVYASGRGLNILKTQLQKNVLAISVVVAFSVLEVLNLIPPKISNILFLVSIGFFVYVVLWQKFYNRSDKFLDKTVGADDDLDGNGFVKKSRKK